MFLCYYSSVSKKDAQALFGTNKVKATALNHGEMAETEAEGIWGAWAGAGAYGAYIWYNDKPFSWGDFGAAVGSGFVLSPW